MLNLSLLKIKTQRYFAIFFADNQQQPESIYIKPNAQSPYLDLEQLSK